MFFSKHIYTITHSQNWPQVGLASNTTWLTRIENVLGLAQSCLRVGWTRGSGHDFAGFCLASTSFFSFLLIIFLAYESI